MVKRLLRSRAASMVTCVACVVMAIHGAHAQQAAGPDTMPITLHATAHFTIEYSDVPEATVARLAIGLERERTRIVSDFGGSGPAMVTIRIHPSYASLARARTQAGIEHQEPGFTVGTSTIHFLSPLVLRWSFIEDAISYLAHELTHCVIRVRNPRLDGNPRWLWESLAVYEAGYKKDPKTLSYLNQLRPPSFAELSSPGDQRAFGVGYTISEFMVSRWGREALVKLVDADGQVERAFAISQEQFEREWFDWVRRTYSL